MNGWYNSYYPNAAYEYVGTYKDGEKDGKWAYHNDDGTMVLEESFVGGRLQGPVVKYDDNGTIADEIIYQDGCA